MGDEKRDVGVREALKCEKATGSNFDASSICLAPYFSKPEADSIHIRKAEFGSVQHGEG